MIVVCECGTRLRLKLETVDTVRCPKCKVMVGTEARRQATRNSHCMLDIAALLAGKEEWTPEETAIAQIMTVYQLGVTK